MLDWAGYIEVRAFRDPSLVLTGFRVVTDEQIRRVEEFCKFLSGEKDFMRAVDEGDSGRVIDDMRSLMQVYDVDIAVVTNTEGVILFRGHDPNKSGDLVAHRRDTATALSGKELTYWSGGSSTTLGYYHTRPLVLDGRIVGTVLAAKSAYVYE